ncbi:hypothetical protein SODALDRAFT_254478, partial [Sodiomyces alkalinus F11]
VQDIKELQRLLREAEDRAAENERRREEEQRRREDAEELARSSQPQTLLQYLEDCHSLYLAVQVVTERSLTTQGDTTNPTGRIFPRRVIPWDDFPAKQEEVWDALSLSKSFSSNPAFPSQHQLEYVKSLLKPISSELGLRDFERDAVENAVQKLVDGAYRDPLLRRALGLQGAVTFESHTNLGNDDTISNSMEHMSLGSDDARATASTSAPRPSTKARRKAKGKGNRADQFCIYRTSDSQNVPAIAIEYKAPHKLSIDEVVTGLESQIMPEHDVINKNGDGFAFSARRLATAVVTQLFSYMIGKSIQYGYVCTGQAFVFLYIPDDPSTVYYSVCVPHLDVLDDDETRLHRTAVAQVFAFILQALCADPPPQSWHDEAEKLDTWAVEYEDILRDIPVTDRKPKEPRASPYKPQRWKGFERSPIRTRSRCVPPDSKPGPSDDDEDPPSPSPNPGGGKVVSRAATGGTNGGKRQRRGGRQDGQATNPNVRNRSFCTQKCLLGLAFGGPMDETCPNSADHGKRHVDRLRFLHLLQEQLARDRDRDADCAPLDRYGARGSLFKARLSTHGYTFVAKGMDSRHRDYLKHESVIYSRLRAIQGKHIPVCLGTIDLRRPWHYNDRVNMHFLLLSWAGQPLFDFSDQVDKVTVAKGVTAIFTAMHNLNVIHLDAEPRNILYDGNGNFMVVDLERAEFRGRQPLSQVSPNSPNRKRKRGISQKVETDDFMKELRSAVEKASSCITGPPNV